MPCIDGLRALAIGMVLFEHFGGYLVKYCSTGYYGVDLFFVISGFLITSILLKDPQEKFRDCYRVFMGRRVLRIFPLYYAVILLLCLANYENVREYWLWLVSYTFNYGAVYWRDIYPESGVFYMWSLSVEEQFYLFWPLIIIALKSKPRVLFGITLFVVVIGFLQKTQNIFPSMTPYNYTGLINRMGSLGIGALAAIYCLNWSLPKWFFRSRVVELLAFLLLAACLIVLDHRPVLLAIISTFLVVKASQFEFRLPYLQKLFTSKLVVYVGSVSYGIYLMHVPIAALTTKYLFDPIWTSIPFDSFGSLSLLEYHSWLIKLPLYSLMATVLAGISFRYFESPILKLKNRWFSYTKKEQSDA